jgi:hypothetical protein
METQLELSHQCQYGQPAQKQTDVSQRLGIRVVVLQFSEPNRQALPY